MKNRECECVVASVGDSACYLGWFRGHSLRVVCRTAEYRFLDWTCSFLWGVMYGSVNLFFEK